MTAVSLPARRRRRIRPARVFMGLALLAFVFFLSFPLLWLLSTSFKTSGEIFQSATFLPGHFKAFSKS